MHGVIQMRKPAKGFPQGGVFSPTFYNISGEAAMFIVNEIKRIAGPGSPLVKQFNRSCNGSGLADDLNAILRGPDLDELVKQMQRIIYALMEWADKFGLTFCNDKTRYALFTQKHKPTVPTLYMYHKPIKEIDQKKGIKYLGVTFDRGLKFDKHIDNKI